MTEVYTENAERAHLSHANDSKHQFKPHVCSHLNTEGFQSFLGGWSSRGYLCPQAGTDLEKWISHLYPISIPVPQNRIPLLPRAIGSNAQSLPFQGQRGSTQLAVNTWELWVRGGKEQNREKTSIWLSQHLLWRCWKLRWDIKWRSRGLSKTTGGEKQMGKGEGEREGGRERTRALQQRSYAQPMYAGTYHKNRKIQRESD